MKKFFEVTKNVVRDFSITLLLTFLSVVSLAVTSFLIIMVVPEIIKIVGNVLVVLGALVLICGFIIAIVLTLHKAFVVSSYAEKNGLSISEAWEKV